MGEALARACRYADHGDRGVQAVLTAHSGPVRADARRPTVALPLLLIAQIEHTTQCWRTGQRGRTRPAAQLAPPASRPCARCAPRVAARSGGPGARYRRLAVGTARRRRCKRVRTNPSHPDPAPGMTTRFLTSACTASMARTIGIYASRMCRSTVTNSHGSAVVRAGGERT